jgi:hypothetical protein
MTPPSGDFFLRALRSILFASKIKFGMKNFPMLSFKSSDPGSPFPRRKEYPASLLVVLVSAGLLYFWYSCYLLGCVGRIPIESDAWSLIEVARSFQEGNFPQVETVRQFKIIDHVFSNVGFPPLTPLLLALHGSEGTWATAMAHQSIVIALALPLALFLVLKSKFRPIEAAIIALLTGIATLSFTPYREDALSGTMSLSTLLLGSAFAILLCRKLGPKEAVLLALLMGLNCLNRTDGLPLAAVMFGAAVCLSSFSATVPTIYLGTFVVTLCPLLLFNKAHFDSFFISDNAPVAEAVSDHVLRVHGVPAQSALHFLSAKFRNLVQFLIASAVSVFHTKPLWFPAAAVVWEMPSSLRVDFFRNPKLWIILVASASAIGPVATGYVWETRYISPLVVAVALLGSTILVESLRGVGSKRLVAYLGLFACLGFAALVPLRYGNSVEPWDMYSQKPADEIRRALQSLQPSEKLFSELKNHPHVFFAIDRWGRPDQYLEISRIGALGKIHAIPEPYDWNELPLDERRRLFAKLHVDLVAGACEDGQAPAFVLSLSGYQGCLRSPDEWLSGGGKSTAH